jgi:hypothetical protein
VRERERERERAHSVAKVPKLIAVHLGERQRSVALGNPLKTQVRIRRAARTATQQRLCIRESIECASIQCNDVRSAARRRNVDYGGFPLTDTSIACARAAKRKMKIILEAIFCLMIFSTETKDVK